MNIFFDLDGVLIDTSKRSYALYRDILIHCGKNPLRRNTYLALKRERKSLRTILRRSGAGNLEHAFRAEWRTRIETEEYLAHDRLFPTAKRVLSLLAARHPLYLITIRRHKGALGRELNRFHIRKYLKRVLIAPQTAERARGKIAVLRAFARKGDIVVGDSETDIRAGKALGLITIAVAGGWRSGALLRRERPDAIVADVRALPSLLFFM